MVEAAEEVLKAVHPVTTPMVTVREVDVLHVTPCRIEYQVDRGEASRFR